METIDLLLTHGVIVTQDDQRRIIQDGALAIRGDRIVALGSTAEIAAQYIAAETLDVAGSAVFPGLINTHIHLFQTGVKGLGEDMPVQDWVEVVTAPTAIHINPEEMYLFCLTGCLEQIHCGVTSLIEMSYAAHSFSLHEANIKAMTDSGLRSRYTTIISDFGEEYGVLPELIKPIEQFLAEYRQLLDRYPVTDRLAVWLAIGAPWTITDEGLVAARAFSRQAGIPIVMHINENEVDNVLSQQRHGLNIVPYLAEVGFLGPDLLAIHCVISDETDIALFAKHDVKVSYNPVSNMYLGSGIAPILQMRDAGLTICLGTDGAGSNNSQDMIESLKIGALLQKVAAKDASVLDAQTVLDWATREAAKVMGLAGDIGSLEVGKKADLFVLAPNSAKIVPVHDPVTTLVYSAGEENVVTTIADGKILMKDRLIQHHDEAAILRQAQQAATALADRCGSNRKVTRRWRP
ncbi:MAG TPA: amidohydrolase [Anaerolineae bacterium]|nr:amidohydrolase [Anaerolineae bacterium]HMR62950.1 amidohydrolase [Anaerolineae bacterium]